MRKLTVLLFACTFMLAFTACVEGDTSTGASDVSCIALQGNSITLDGDGATVAGSSVTITSAGTYSISGSLADGQILVDTTDSENVNIILNGVDISCSTSAPIHVLNAEKVVITLADGSRNSVKDGNSYSVLDEDSEPNAAIFSKDDLTIKGSGTLTVDANYNDGITSKDDLKITGGVISVQAVNDGIRGRDSVEIKGGTISVNAAGDGIQSNNDEDTEKGYIAIEDGTLLIVAGADGIQAETSLTISGGDITVTSGTGSDSDSGKGLKAGVAVTITGGTLSINASDDAVHSNDSVGIDGGDLTLASSDDAIHADSSLEINGGDITITRCYEGLDSAAITLNGGNVHLVARDDGINAVTKGTSSDMMGRPGQNNGEATGSNTLTINGGYLVVNADGDGLDINGPITMTAGTVIVNGPTNNGNGPVDYLGSFSISGGDFLAVGSAGMAMGPSTSSTQNSMMLTYAGTQAAGTLIHIESADGDDILTFAPAKAYQSVVFSSPELSSSSEYVVYSGGSSSGTSTDGLYSGGTYTPGTEVTRFTVSGTVTTVGSQNGQMPGIMPGTMPGNMTPNTPAPGNMVNNRTSGMPGNPANNMNGYVPGNAAGGMTSNTPGNAVNNRTSGMPGNPANNMNGYVPGNAAGGMNGYMPGSFSSGMTGYIPGSVSSITTRNPSVTQGYSSVYGIAAAQTGAFSHGVTSYRKSIIR